MLAYEIVAKMMLNERKKKISENVLHHSVFP